MIPRYEIKEFSHLWSDHHRFETYLKVELAVLAALGPQIPKGVLKEIRAKAVINPQRIDEIEQLTRHDVIAFCTSITENLPAEVGKYFHYGVTSSDIIDTSLALVMKESSIFVLKAVADLKEALKEKAIQTKTLLAMGRSHGIYAEPLSFGQKLLGHYCELQRRERDLVEVYENEITGKISGAVGNYTLINRQTELKALQSLGLKREGLSTQVVPRDRIAKIISTHALTATFIERLAVEIRHLHRTEVGEVHEGFQKGQKGSSTMPHKRNPISCENLTGIARVLRSHLPMALENCVLWHERDISHSSSERMYLPDNFGLLIYGLKRLTETVKNLVVHSDKIEQRVCDHFSYLSSFYLHHLIENLPLSREECYSMVQSASFAANNAQEFHQLLQQEVKKKNLLLNNVPSPTPQELKKIYLREVDSLFEQNF